VRFDLSVVAGGDKFAVQGVRPFEQGVPLDMSITEDARVGRASGQVFFYKVIDDVVAKFIANIDNEMVESHIYGYLAGIVDGIEAATAGFLLGASGVGVIPGFHGDAHHFVALIVQHHGRDGAIDSSAHGHQYASVLTHTLLVGVL